MQYKLDADADFGTAIPTAKNAGTYKVYYKVVGGDGYANTAENFVTVTIAKKAVTVSPKNVTVTKGKDLPTFELEFKGLVGEEVITLDAKPILTCLDTEGNNVTKDSATGKYVITWSNVANTTFINADNYEVTKVAEATLEIKSSGGSSGGSSSVVTTPGKAAKDFVKNSMSANGSTIKNVSKDNYKQVLEAADKYNKLSAAEKEAVDKEMKAQTGKTMAELIAEAEAIKAAEDGSAATFDVQKAVKELTLKARSSKLKSGNVKIVLKGDLSEIEKNGYTVKYKFYRSTKKAKGYKAAVTKDAPNYLNTAGKKGKMYYYKARVMVYDKDGNLVAKTELKQCKYANRTWTKK